MLAGILLLAAPVLAVATDVPVEGRRLTLRAKVANPAKRRLQLELRDAAIAAPLPDPRTAGATLLLHGGAVAGQCAASAALAPSRWEAIGGDGARRGWRYRDRDGTVLGIRRVLVRPGVIKLSARGAGWPCALDAAQRLPVRAVVRVGDTRWCGAFGGVVRHNEVARFQARDAAPPAACPKADVTAASLNILHGLFCPAPTVSCRFGERAQLVADWIAARGCPDVVTLQEIWQPQVPTLEALLPGLCGGAYTAVHQVVNTIDDVLILTRWPVVAMETQRFHLNFRHGAVVRLDHPLGPVDVFSTHLASGSDGGPQPCGASCPAECVAAGAVTVRDCQAEQMARFVESRHAGSTAPAVVTGDLNAQPGSYVHTRFTGRGWPDVYTLAGAPACDPGTGVGCTSGREDEALDDLESPARNVDARIDSIFLEPPVGGTCSVDDAADADGDGVATRLFADEPNPFVPACGPAPAAICWPSDHVGVQVDANCG